MPRKPLTPGEPMKVRHFRATESDWADFKFIGTETVRKLVRKEAARLRRNQQATKEKSE